MLYVYLYIYLLKATLISLFLMEHIQTLPNMMQV